MKTIAFYLPQFHEIPENNKWWGNGFTEWTNLKKAKPLFKGHQQPKIPLDNNYYNLLDKETIKWQISLAKANGVDGFCIYHYWYEGKMLLEKPAEILLENDSLDIGFCFCWANHSWTKVWAGKSSEILIKQTYGEQNEWEKHFQYLLRFFKDKRYIKEDNKPVLVIYAPQDYDQINEWSEYMNKRCLDEGFNGIVLMCQSYVLPDELHKIRQSIKYRIDFQPQNVLRQIENEGKKRALYVLLRKADKLFTRLTNRPLSDFVKSVNKEDYDKIWMKIIEYFDQDEFVQPCAVVNWDNTPRRGKSGRVFINATPQKFELYLKTLIEKSLNTNKKYLFITAWNEWSEGCYLEPDTFWEYGFILALKKALGEKNVE